ncbi:MAG: DoxX family protein [Planctomycetota bacterium]
MQSKITLVARLVAAVILGQTLFFKFTGAEESVHIFTTLGAEPWGRIGSGVAELIAVLLLLMPRTAAIGGAMTVGLMVGAVGSHLGPLGIDVQGDGGTLFTMALIALVAGAVVAWIGRRELPIVGGLFRKA